MPDLLPGEDNLLWAYALIDGLAANGVTRAVISPGSRSTPLVLACDGHPSIEVTVQVDERCAAFFALGLAKQSHKPVILIATSGSAPAHWYPAIIEASHSNIPLVLLTADRPPELHGWGANQTTDQQRLFGSHLRTFHDPGPALAGEYQRGQINRLGQEAATDALFPHPGPVQINMPFREPLLPERPIRWPVASRHESPDHPSVEADPETVALLVKQITGKPGIILCGTTDLGSVFAHAVTRLAEQLNCPILADPLSNLRNGNHNKQHVMAHYDAFIESLAVQIKPHWVLRFGALPVSKPLLQYLDKTAAPQYICDPYQQWTTLPPHGRRLIISNPIHLCQAMAALQPQSATMEWFSAFQQLNTAAANIMRPTPLDDRPFEGTLIQELLDCLPDQSLLFSGNSMPIRQLDSWSGTQEKAIHIAANRGVSGIDGNISSFIGMAESGYTAKVALLGDLAFYHDMNGLLAATNKKLVFILVNNNGGGIFGYLPQSNLDTYTKYWNTSTDLDFQHCATLYGLNYHPIRQQSDFRPALEQALKSNDPQLIEVFIDRDYSISRHREYRAQVARQITT